MKIFQFSALVALVCAGVFGQGQRPDPNFHAKVDDPVYHGNGPIVLFDAAHFNVHTAEDDKGLADLMTSNGYTVKPNQSRFTPEVLQGNQILIIINARAAGFDAPMTERAKPAFKKEECEAVREWVRAGGGLLLSADHWPIGDAMEILSLEFGVSMGKGHTSDPVNSDTQLGGISTLVFSRENKLLGDHPVTRGRNDKERVNRIVAFTGQSLAGPKGSVAFMILGDTAYDESPPPERKKSPATGRAQGIALEFGKGRVVVLGEAAMLTAQIAGPRNRPMGMSAPNNDDRQLALNIMHWLSRVM